MMRIIRDCDLWFLIQDAKNKRIILYTDTIYYKEICSLFYHIDVKIDYAISDQENEELRSIYDLMYENPDEIMIVIAKDEFFRARKKLEGMGFKLGVNFKDIRRYSVECSSAPYYYDPICGYNLYTDGGEHNGFQVFGNVEDKNSIRILTMGGSTTDAFLYSFRSWSEFLHEALIAEGVNNVVLCGGVSGYSSAEELLKLIRDGIPLQPDIVINYTGSNDIKLDDHPYINSYMKRISNYLERQNRGVGTRFNSNPFGVTWGIEMTSDSQADVNYSFWYNNEKMIHAICGAYEIKHVTIYQPNLCNGKKNLSLYEKEYLLNSCYCGVQKQSIKENAELSMQFRRKVKEQAVKEEWIEDVSDLFDEQDVYLDRLHVNEEGNRLIAEKVFDIMKNKEWI
ncbi:MAG: SGNH/GDSL hydrolase family protein [Lachnospiraceae bacterium]|nr:SGNH/GDSL hydrolase family protein [Lachnospiraceae bacterium]